MSTYTLVNGELVITEDEPTAAALIPSGQPLAARLEANGIEEDGHYQLNDVETGWVSFWADPDETQITVDGRYTVADLEAIISFVQKRRTLASLQASEVSSRRVN